MPAAGARTNGEARLDIPLVVAQDGPVEDVELASPRVSGQQSQALEVAANCWQRLTFSWIGPLIAEGYRREVRACQSQDPSAFAARGAPVIQQPSALVEADLSELRPDDEPDVLCKCAEDAWVAELQRPLPAQRSFRRALRVAFLATFACGGCFKFLYDSLQMVGPFVLKNFLAYLGSCNDGGECDVWVGVRWVCILCATNLTQTAFLHQYFHRCFRTGMRMNSATVSVIYSKALKIAGGGAPAQGEQKRTSGEIVNLMSVDAQRLQDTMTYLHTLWSGPYQITITLCFLFFVVHWATLAGVAVMVLQVPFVAILSRRIKLAQRALMKIKDERIKVTNEVFGSVRLLKMYGWEDSFGRRLDGIRQRELVHLRKYQMLNIFSSAIYATAPILTGVATFGTYTALYGPLSAATAFTALALFNVLRFPLTMFPNMVSSAVEANVALRRIQEFLESSEIRGRQSPPTAAIAWENKSAAPSSAIQLREARIAWPNGTTLLTGATFDVPAPLPSQERGHLTVVLGAVGTGKSGLLQALIGDLSPMLGSIVVRGTIGYCSQVAWIRNTTVRDNILFNSPVDEARYNAVIKACALMPDLEMLPAGEQTEIGEKGVNLSGGQKQRVALARAVYAAPDLLLLDDPLSAVDLDVAQKLLAMLRGPLVKGCSIVLCTHHVGAIRHADQVILLTRCGSGDSVEKDQASHETHISFCGAPDDFLSRHPEMEAHAKEGFERQVSGSDDRGPDEATAKAKHDTGRLMEKEVERVGAVSWDVYKCYIDAAGGTGLAAVVILGMCFGQALQTTADSWVSYWSDHSAPGSPGYISGQIGLVGYVVASFGAFLGIFGTSALFRLTALNAARSFHRQLLDKMLQLPMPFYDTTPLGRVLNRFSKDVYTVDEQLQSTLYTYLQTQLRVVATITVIAVATPWFLAIIVPLLWLYRSTQNYYVPTSRQLKRIESNLRSPIFSHFSETLEGVATIRAFGQQPQFLAESLRRLKRQMRAYYFNVSSNRWLAVRLETMGTVIVSSAGLLAVLARNTVQPGIAGLSISYALSVTQSLNWVVRMTADRETNIVSVERLRDFISRTPEPPRWLSGADPAANTWPSGGRIDFENVYMRYRPELPLLLEGLSLQVNAGEKLGICGRTGAGKSTLFNVLLRIVEPESGRVLIDGIDVAGIGLHRLRRSITIIPQDPVLFSGTLRFNLDPLAEQHDEAIWTALKGAHLASHVEGLDGRLDAAVAEHGSNFSVGQRQQLCLARALLRSNRILLLDEATSAVDMEMDALIQETIRKGFADHTVLCIAHRIDTIAKFDRICVVDAGQVAELGRPEDLLGTPGSRFGRLQQGQINAPADV